MNKFRFIEHFPIGSVGALNERPRAIGDRPYELSCSINRNLKGSNDTERVWEAAKRNAPSTQWPPALPADKSEVEAGASGLYQ